MYGLGCCDNVFKRKNRFERANQQLFRIQPFIDGFIEDQQTASRDCSHE